MKSTALILRAALLLATGSVTFAEGSAAAPGTPEWAPVNAPESGAPQAARTIVIRGIDSSDHAAFAPGRETGWLGLSVEETPEALNAQLGLEPGAGLTVNFVAPDSPAAKAGFKKNDVLVRLEDQLLVHPAQFRKLVQNRKEGDEVSIVFFRAGKEQTAQITIGKSRSEPDGGLSLAVENWGPHLKELREQLKELPVEQGFREQMNALRESLSNLKIDQSRVQEELKSSLEEARRSLERALSQSSNLNSALNPAREAIKKLEQRKVVVDRDATVTVRSGGNSVRSMVQSDDQGTLVLIADPKPRLTAHDTRGKMLFDGPVETPNQQQQVPPEVWNRAEPMLKRLLEDGAPEK